jgi:hypothetical protein
MSKLFGKKGQAALEFLTTYGWAFMVILVMIGALAYFGVLNPGKLIQDQCVSTAGIECTSYQIDLNDLQGGTVSASFKNNIGKAVTINNVDIKYKGTTVATCADPGNVVDLQTPVAVSVRTGNGIISAGPPPIDNSVMPEYIFQLRDCVIANGLIAGKKAGDKIKLDFQFEYIAQEPGEFSHLASGTITATAK